MTKAMPGDSGASATCTWSTPLKPAGSGSEGTKLAAPRVHLRAGAGATVLLVSSAAIWAAGRRAPCMLGTLLPPHLSRPSWYEKCQPRAVVGEIMRT